MRTEIIEILQKEYPEYCMKHIDTADKILLFFEEKQKKRGTGIKDSKGNEIHFGDTLRFVDKWEWYRGEWGWKLWAAKTEEDKEKLKQEYESLPYEERLIEDVQDYEWLLSSEIQTYWEIISK